MYSFQVFMYRFQVFRVSSYYSGKFVRGTVIWSVTSTDAQADSASSWQRVIRPRLLSDPLWDVVSLELRRQWRTMFSNPSPQTVTYMAIFAWTLATSRYYSLFEEIYESESIQRLNGRIFDYEHMTKNNEGVVFNTISRESMGPINSVSVAVTTRSRLR